MLLCMLCCFVYSGKIRGSERSEGAECIRQPPAAECSVETCLGRILRAGYPSW